ncbi:transglycosylase SLT domain-containing protein [Alisedimentitalea sp. MJ-SS2]|uniref:transglycosylase SLT domain-containing protein n=1 Tax=Aliisedimentitalea sp. MJ-SS2 TaxID=3049795 RepID=UPI00290D6D68|nr:transglycosylase SLT domain-containing protein [Alisedimentitalea sp. MJ-SS2]MDU8926392.1 transglycosylase SLT domain-containing protein [Alisedimentitalea sp. MJ-SS2]
MRIAVVLLALALGCPPGAGLSEEVSKLAVAATQAAGDVPARLRPRARLGVLPNARWAHRPGADLWTRAAMVAMQGHGAPLIKMVPGDIRNWCPAYPQAGPDQRGAFWVGFMSALAKHESTYRADAVGGGGLWYGLLQILPATARGYRCRARSGEALKDGAANLSCAIRIMAVTVPRDGVVHGYTKAKKRRWRGVSADWGPMRSSKKRADMAGWLRKQSYCKSTRTIRPVLRPEGLAMQKG